MYFAKKMFKEGDEVAHKENIGNKMEVRRIIRTKRKPKADGSAERVFTLGIECGWWQDRLYHVQSFHTNSLVPWDVAEQGHIEVLKYLDRVQNVTI